MIIDSHTHPFTFPSIVDLRDKIRTTEDVAKFRSRYPNLSLKHLETFESPIDIVDYLIQDMDSRGVEMAIIQPIPNVGASEVAKAVRKYPGRLVGLCPVGSTFELPPTKYNLNNTLETHITEAVEKHGLKGIAEVHLGSFANNPQMIPVGMTPLLDVLAKRRLPLLVHTGWSQHAGDIELQSANPIHLDNVAACYPEVTFILAHMGRQMYYFFEPALAVALRNSNVYLDTADSCAEHIRIAVEKLGADRIMFGTDWSPTQRFIREPADIYSFNLTQVYQSVQNKDDREWVLWKTAQKVYGI